MLACLAIRGGFRLERLRNYLVRLRATLWLLPAGISVLACVLAFALLTWGPDFAGGTVDELWWLFSGDAETARDLLSTLASGMITMTSLVVSITVVVLTLAANQLGPRLVSRFMADNQIKAVLGLFIGTILYLLTLLRSLNGDLAADQVPHLAVTVGTGLAVMCLFALLVYVHKIARSIIADTVVHDVTKDLRHAIAANLPEPTDNGLDEADPAHEPGPGLAPERWLSADRSGYVQVIDYHALVKLAQREDVVLRLGIRPGHFVLPGGRHVAVLSAKAEELQEAIFGSIVIGAERSPAQDIEYAIRQLVEIAVRALSPGINDPFTAIAVIDQLGAALADIMALGTPEAVRRDQAGRVRVLADVAAFDGLIAAAFDQIRQAAQSHPAILIELADILGKLAPSVRTEAQRRAILSHLAMIEGAGRRHIDEPADEQDLAVRIAAARHDLEPASDGYGVAHATTRGKVSPCTTSENTTTV